MFIRNLKFDKNNYYKCTKVIADYLFSKGFSEIGNDDGMIIFQNTQQLQAALKVMPFHLKIVAKLGGDSNER